MSELFEPRSPKYALRGDRRLWIEMLEKSRGVTTDGIGSEEDCKKYLYQLFSEITGHTLKEGETIYIKRFDPGHGISSGRIVMSWWIMVGIPLLLKRFVEKSSPSKNEADFFNELNNKLRMKYKV